MGPGSFERARSRVSAELGAPSWLGTVGWLVMADWHALRLRVRIPSAVKYLSFQSWRVAVGASKSDLIPLLVMRARMKIDQFLMYTYVSAYPMG